MTDFTGHKKRVLIIDDEPHILKIYGIKLKLAGFEVNTTTSGAEGIRLVRECNPDAVILDILMPAITGFNVLEEVRKFSQVPIIVFTARSEMITMAVRLGANDYITKPADPDLLVKKINTVLQEKCSLVHDE